NAVKRNKENSNRNKPQRSAPSRKEAKLAATLFESPRIHQNPRYNKVACAAKPARSNMKRRDPKQRPHESEPMNMSTASRYPHYYLADVPHDLRRRVLDLCIHRQWQDAQDLLCAHSFRQYTLADLQSFYDWAPTILEQPYRSADSLSACPPSTDAASTDIQVARGARVAVASERRQLPTAPPSEPSHAASPEVP